MSNQITIVQQKINTPAIPTQLRMSVLSSLRSGELISEQPTGYWGNTEWGYDFIETGKARKVCNRRLTADEIRLWAPVFQRPSIDAVKSYVATMLIFKKSSLKETLGAWVEGVAFELAEYTHFAILGALRDVTISKGDWVPTPHDMIELCKAWQRGVDDMLHHSQVQLGNALEAPKQDNTPTSGMIHDLAHTLKTTNR